MIDGLTMVSLIYSSCMGNSFRIDWNDSDSAADFLEEALEIVNIDMQLDFGVVNPREQMNLLQIFELVNQQFKTHGYQLVGLISCSDDYHQFLMPSDIVEAFLLIMAQLDVMVGFNEPN